MSTGALEIEQLFNQLASDGVQVDTTIIEKAKAGDGNAIYHIGEIYYKVPDHAKAMSWYLQSAQKEYAIANNSVGYLYHQGEGVPVDYKVAMEWYLKGANQGNVDAMYNIGDLHYNGQGVPVDKQQAIIWYQKSADGGLEKGKAVAVKLNQEGFYADSTQKALAEMQKTIEQLKIQNQDKDKAYEEHIKSLEGKLTELSQVKASPPPAATVVVTNGFAPSPAPAAATTPAPTAAANKPAQSSFGGFSKLMKGFDKIMTKLSADETKPPAATTPKAAAVPAATPAPAAPVNATQAPLASAAPSSGGVLNQSAQTNEFGVMTANEQNAQTKNVQNSESQAGKSNNERGEEVYYEEEIEEYEVEEQNEVEEDEEEEEDEENEDEEEDEDEEEEDEEDEDEDEEEEEEEEEEDDDDDY